MLCKLSGPLLFLNIAKFQESVNNNIKRMKPSVILFNFEHCNIIDSTGAHIFHEFIEDLKTKDIDLILFGVNKVVMETMTRSGLVHELDEDCFTENYEKAVEMAEKILAGKNTIQSSISERSYLLENVV